MVDINWENPKEFIERQNSRLPDESREIRGPPRKRENLPVVWLRPNEPAPRKSLGGGLARASL